MLEISRTKIHWLHQFYGWKKVDPEYFEIEDFTTINGNIQLVRIDPGIARHHMYRASHINFLGPFQLFQCDAPSVIRQGIPLRFFYSQQYGKVFELNGKNMPIYEMMTFIDTQEKVKEEVIGDDLIHWLERHVDAYFRVFFDNVTGRHGRFELVEDYSQLMNRLATYHVYLTRKGKLIGDQTQYSEAEKQFQARVKDLLAAADATFDFNGSYAEIKPKYMLFKNSFFKTSIRFHTEPFGVVALADESLVSYQSLFEGVPDERNIESLKLIAESSL